MQKDRDSAEERVGVVKGNGGVSVTHADRQLGGTYGSEYLLFQAASWYVDACEGGWCELHKDGKPAFAHPTARAREKKCEWLAEFHENIPFAGTPRK